MEILAEENGWTLLRTAESETGTYLLFAQANDPTSDRFFLRFTAKNDARVTRAGRIMRKFKMDELPQLFNIIKGEMSFVGPRPELLLYTTQYTEEQQCIMWVRPGVTDRSSIVYIAQDEIVGEEDPVANFEKLILPEKNRLRVEYAKSQSFGLDCRLLLETVKGVFGKAEAMARERKQ